MADTKNVYEQLEELKEKLNEANKPRTLVEQLANNDPAVIEFVKTAKENGYICAYNHPWWSMEDESDILSYEGFLYDEPKALDQTPFLPPSGTRKPDGQGS